MAVLNDKPGSSSKKQHSTLVIAGQRLGFDLNEIRGMVGGSIRKLSARGCSDWIQTFTGRDLPNAPGKKPRPYKKRRSKQNRDREGAVFRMIQPDHTHQICRLMREYFENDHYAQLWLRKNFKVGQPHELLTAQRAGEVIAVLKRMLARRPVPSVSSVVQSAIDNRMTHPPSAGSAISDQPQGVAL